MNSLPAFQCGNAPLRIRDKFFQLRNVRSIIPVTLFQFGDTILSLRGKLFVLLLRNYQILLQRIDNAEKKGNYQAKFVFIFKLMT